MTEYDFSPEAYQAHLENMNRISRWVDRTEGHRAEFGNAAALTEDQLRNSPPSHSPKRRKSFGGRRRKSPPSLSLHAYSTPDSMYGMTPYPSPIHLADDRNLGVLYGRDLRSPGTMPMYGPGYQDQPMPHSAGGQIMTLAPPNMFLASVTLPPSSPGTMPMYGPGYQVQPVPHSAGAQMMTLAPLIMPPAPIALPPSLPHHHHRRSRSQRSNSYSLVPPFMTAPLSAGYVQAEPKVMILRSTSSKHHRSGKHKGQQPVSYVYL